MHFICIVVELLSIKMECFAEIPHFIQQVQRKFCQEISVLCAVVFFRTAEQNQKN
jgi:hypothetical protein